MTERRKNHKPRMSIGQILDYMQDAADERYQGNLQDNLFIIFNGMNLGDKKTFLRKSLMLHWKNQIDLARGGLQEVVIDEDMRIDQESITLERKKIVDVNPSEQEKLKNWLLKVLFVVGTILFVGILLMSYMVTEGSLDIGEMLGYFVDLFKLLI